MTTPVSAAANLTRTGVSTIPLGSFIDDLEAKLKLRKLRDMQRAAEEEGDKSKPPWLKDKEPVEDEEGEEETDDEAREDEDGEDDEEPAKGEKAETTIDAFKPEAFKADDEKDDSELKTKEDADVNYRYSLTADQRCGTCTNFVEPSACKRVIGLIREVDVCDLWEEGQEDDEIEDEILEESMKSPVPIVRASWARPKREDAGIAGSSPIAAAGVAAVPLDTDHAGIAGSTPIGMIPARTGEEVAPPGYEHVVKKLKTKPTIDNPWAVAWAMKNKTSEDELTPIRDCGHMNEDECYEAECGYMSDAECEMPFGHAGKPGEYGMTGGNFNPKTRN